MDDNTYRLWAGDGGEPKPITLEDIQRAVDKVKQADTENPMRIVSHEVYKRAEEALIDGAAALEIEWILAGASKKLAKKMAGRE